MNRLRGTFLACLFLACLIYLWGFLTSYTSVIPALQPGSFTMGGSGTNPGTTGTTGTTTGVTGTTGTTGTTTGTTGTTGTTVSEPATTAIASLEEGHGYNYDALTEEQQALYDLILQAVREPGTEVNISADLAEEDDEVVFRAVTWDHPECFWIDGYQTTTYTNAKTVSCELNMDQAEIASTAASIEAEAQTFLSTIDDDTSTYDRVRATYEWIINRAEYQETDNDQNLKGVFLDKTAVCAGYSRAFQYLCHEQGIPCAYIGGTTNDGVPHSWCLVEIDGTPTYVDPTWGDPTFETPDASAYGDGIVYDYLCITTDEMYRDRTSDIPLEKLPVCDSTEYDYYRLQGLFLEEFSPESVEGLLKAAVDSGEPSVRFKLGSKEAYDQALEYLNSEDARKGVMSSYSKISWYYEDTLFIIDAFWE